jgi:hypothetical protein
LSGAVHFDYDLQVWVKDSKIQRCGHPDSMRSMNRVCCNQYRYNGYTLEQARRIDQNRLKLQDES